MCAWDEWLQDTLLSKINIFRFLLLPASFQGNQVCSTWLLFFKKPLDFGLPLIALFERILANCSIQKQWIMHTQNAALLNSYFQHQHRYLLVYNWTKTTQKFASFLCALAAPLSQSSSLKILDNFWTKLKLAVIICSLHVKFNSADDCCRIWLS